MKQLNPITSTHSLRYLILMFALLAPLASPLPAAETYPPIPGAPAVTAPPETLNIRNLDRAFYKKYINVGGMPVLASGEVADAALQRTWWIVTHILAGRPDILKAMAEGGTRLIIIGASQVYTDMPEYRGTRNPDFQNERVRGTGGARLTSFGEENLLNLPLDRYDDMSVGVHEFCHTIDGTLSRIDRAWRGRLRSAFQHAVDQGLWKGSYAGSNPAEYWAEMCTAYFGCERLSNWNHCNIGTREQLKEYDPMGYELVRSTFKLTPATDWFYQPYQLQPSIIKPPAKFKIDPYYTKFTWAHEFNVVGRAASDEALYKANDTIRKMFAYRHDILKIFINENAKLVVLGRGERLSDLPEFKGQPEADTLLRMADYTTATKTLAVCEENTLGASDDPYLGRSMVIRAFAKAVYDICGTRPYDEAFEKRPRMIWQQYELGVTCLDLRWGRKVRDAYKAAMAAGKWKGTSSVQGAGEYWAGGVLAYFDAAGPGWVPGDAPHPIRTREELKAYDPELFALVAETMAYGGHEDWRYDARRPYTRSPEMTMRPPVINAGGN